MIRRTATVEDEKRIKKKKKENIWERVNYCHKLEPKSIIDGGEGESDFRP